MKVIICKERKQAYGKFSFFFNIKFLGGCVGSLLLLRLSFSFCKGGLISICGVRASCCRVSLVVEHGLQSARASGAAAPRLQSRGSAVVAHGLSCFTSCGIFLDQGLNPCLQLWQADTLPLSHQGSPRYTFVSDTQGHEGTVGQNNIQSKYRPRGTKASLWRSLRPALASTLSLGTEYLQAGLALLRIQLLHACQSPAQQDGRFTQC